MWDGKFPTAADLDRVAPEHPVVLRTKSGHAAWANSLALQLAHITSQAADPPGGEIMRDENGSAPDNTGISAVQPEILREAILKANGHGLAATAHANGDRANREVLNSFAEARRMLWKTGLPNRIEHVQLLHPNDACRLAELGLIASMQQLHATSDMHIADQHWGKRSAGAYALRTQLDCGAILALGSDCPVETLDPLAGIQAAETRRRADGTPGPKGWYHEQRLTVEQAVREYTFRAAYAVSLEEELGSLARGIWADLTILDQDIFEIDPI